VLGVRGCQGRLRVAKRLAKNWLKKVETAQNCEF